MPSIVPGYEYDIFISYRHKDNKYDGWVTEFVSNLKKEIAATFKEELSIYFDNNPQDGLLETQHVDKSLEGKLKCLIFIPILSQTYCDPESFAWRHEFCAFNKIANSDQFGLYIRLANGNVNSRILPVKIHELETQDVQMLSKELGGTLRSLDFIYRTPGVNRPLRALEDEPKENLNHLFYRDQINKVANTIKRTIVGIRMQGSQTEKIQTASFTEETIHPKRSTNKKKVLLFSILALLIVLTLAYLYFLQKKGDAKIVDRSIAVLPFVDLSPQNDQEYFSDGLSEELLNLLTRIPELKVISRTSAFSFKGKNEDVRTIGEKLGVAHILEGSLRKSGNKIRITAQLILVSDGSHIWSKTFDRTIEDIFVVQDEIATAVVNELRITLMGDPLQQSVTSNTEAYNLYLQGKYFLTKRTQENVLKATENFLKALELDKNSASIWAALSLSYASQANDGYLNPTEGFTKAREAAEKSIQLDGNLATGHYALASIQTTYDWDWAGAQEELAMARKLDPSNFGVINMEANLALTMGKFEEAILLYKKALVLDPLRVAVKVNLGMALMYSNHLEEAVTILNSAIEMNPQFPSSHYRLGLCYLLLGKAEPAIAEIEKEKMEDWRMQGHALAYSSTANDARADSLLHTFITKYQDVSAFQIAEVYAYRNEIGKAFEWLNKAYSLRDGGLTSILGNPWLRTLEKDPRYSQFLIKLKLRKG